MNKTIVDQFKLLVKQIKYDIDFTTGKQQLINMYRLSSVQKVLKYLEGYPKKISSSDQLKGIKNIGAKSLIRIDEILKTGKLAEIKITEESEKYLQIISQLEDIFGIGRKKAYELFKKHDITSISDLQAKYKKGLIELPDNIIKGLKYVGKIKENIPRAEIDDLKLILDKTTLEINPKLFGVICGSYRRGNNVSNDVDFVLVHTNMKTKNDTLKHNYLTDFVNALKKKGIIVDSLTGDDVPTKYMGIVKIKKELRRLDIRYVPCESFYSAILYFTGSRDLNKKMRQLAIDSDYVLNEYGLFNEKQKMFKVTSEKDIFDLLGMEYLPPEKRNLVQ